MQADILIVSNGPGELASWVHPVVRQLRAQYPQGRVIVALVPCPYASGAEADTLAGWDEPVAVWTPQETMRYVLWGRKPAGYENAARGTIVFLGGDQLFGALLSLRTGFPLLTYTETAGRWSGFTQRYLVSDRATFARLRQRGVPEPQLELVGNLMVDAVRPSLDPTAARRQLSLRPDAMVLGLLPGSKPFKVRYVTPLFVRVCEILQAELPGLQVVLHRSPFTSREALGEAAASERYAAVTGGATAVLMREGRVDWLESRGGARIQIIPPEWHQEGLEVADVALTVPGTNTAELAILGVPMVVALPLHKPEEIPLDGLLGRLAALPGLGKLVMNGLARSFAARKPLVALPNQRAGRMLTPELIGAFPPERLALAVRELLEDPVARREIKLSLHTAMGGPGAAAAVTEAILAQLREPPARSITEDSAASQP